MKRWGSLILSVLLLGSLCQGQVTRLSNTVYINFGMPEVGLDGEVLFNDINNNNGLDANERAQITFNIKNNGKYDANNVKVRTVLNNVAEGIILPSEINLGNLGPNETKMVRCLVSADDRLVSGQAKFSFEILENEAKSTAIPFEVNTYSIISLPQLDIISFGFSSKSGNPKIVLDSDFIFTIRLKNKGGGPAKNVRFDIEAPRHIVVTTLLEDVVIESLPAGETRDIKFELYAGPNYNQPNIPIRVTVSEINEGSGDKETCTAYIVDK